jgi:hypothetical protein
MLSKTNIGNAVVISVNFWHFGTITNVRRLRSCVATSVSPM